MPLESITKNHPYAHIDSGKIYTVITIGDMVVYERDDDGKRFQLSQDRFKERFRELTDTEREQEKDPGVGTLYEPTELDTRDRLILPDTVVVSALDGLRLVTIRDKLDEIWGLSTVMPLKGRCVMNFYGPPGTGKTALARALAREVGKPLYQVDYSAIISKWLGDTAKHIKAAFEAAKAHNAILFFDEADSLLSRRITDMSESNATSLNQNRNVLMQELDRHDGIVICATNLIKNYDEAIMRRIVKHVKFSLPDEAARLKIFQLHFPKMDRVKITDWAPIAAASGSLSGGDILTTCVNAMLAGSSGTQMRSWCVTPALLMAEIDHTLQTKADNGSPLAIKQLTKNLGSRLTQILGPVDTTTAEDGP